MGWCSAQHSRQQEQEGARTELGRLFFRLALDSMMTAPCCMMGSNLSTHWLKAQPRISPPCASSSSKENNLPAQATDLQCQPIQHSDSTCYATLAVF